MTARTAATVRGFGWVLAAAMLATAAPVAGMILGGAAIAFALRSASHDKSWVWCVPLLWAGTAALLLGLMFSWRVGLT